MSYQPQKYLSFYALLLCATTTTATQAADWYVSAAMGPGGNGSAKRAFNSLQAVEVASGAGDTIFILPSPASKVLDGQIALKPDQRLIGLGPNVINANENAAAARITYSSGGGTGYPAGGVVQLSTGNEIANIHFQDMEYGGLVANGTPFTGANIHHNLFTGGNEYNGWPRLSVYLVASSGHSEVSVHHNVFRDGVFLGGIIVYGEGDSSGEYRFNNNHFENIGFRPHALATFDTAVLEAEILDSTTRNIGVWSEYANSDSILMQLSQASVQTVRVERYHYDNPGQFGGSSNTGLELFFPGPAVSPPGYWADGAQARLEIRDSSFNNAVTEAIQLLNFGSNSLMDVEIDNTQVLNANPRQINEVFPFLSGAAVTVVPDAIGDTGSETYVKVDNSDFVGSSGYGFGVYDLGAQGLNSVIDLGGGALGSAGNNRFLDNAEGDIELLQSNGSGQNNWWGGDAPQITSIGGGVFDTAPELSADPRL